MPSCLFLHQYYSSFLQSIYSSRDISRLSYREQLAALCGARFGDSDYYSYNLAAAGWETYDAIINAAALQLAWAKENCVNVQGLNIAVAQIIAKKPDVVYFQDISIASAEFIAAIRPYVKIIAGQHASPIPPSTHFSGFDILISSLPHYVERFRALGVAAYYQPLAFEARILTETAPPKERNISCSFVGGFSQVHKEADRLLEYIARNTNTDFWGYGSDILPSDSAIRSKHHGEAWGSDMFGIFRRSRLTVNRHIKSVAQNYANNMRLFEATGCGTLLLTDAKDNLAELFEPNKEVAVFHSPEECAELITYYEAHTDEASRIAVAGQKRTLAEHTYAVRMKQTAEWLERHLRYKREKSLFEGISLSDISSGHKNIDKSDITNDLRNGWLDKDIPPKQRALTQKELSDMYRGTIPMPYKIAADAFEGIVRNGLKILEIGCSSGYYTEVLEYLTQKKIQYCGVDISPDFIAMARDYYPNSEFITADGASLPFADRAFDIVFSAGVLLYATEYAAHIAETCRVADKWIILHRTPLCAVRPTQFLKKRAYGVDTVELIFNEQELRNEFLRQGFILDKTLVIAESNTEDYSEKTFVFKRKTYLDKSNSYDNNNKISRKHEPEIKQQNKSMVNQAQPPYPPTLKPVEILLRRAEEFMQKGMQLMQQGDFAGALSHLDESMIIYSQMPNTQYLRSICFWRLGRIDEAFTALSGELKVAPHNQQALYAAAMASRAIKPFIETAAVDFEANAENQIKMLRNFEFKIYSQSGEDGILMGILSRIGITNKRFIEIGIGNGDECNTANLAINHNWSGLLIDGNMQQVEAARQFYAHLKNIRIEQCFITLDNVNELFLQNKYTGALDVFSLDIDGNDYWIMDRVNVINPRVVILEYNPSFGPDRSVTIPYDPEFYRMNYHKSGWYHGASLTALTKLMRRKGYILAGCDSNGYNAFFVREDAAHGVLRDIEPAEAYYSAKPRFRYGTPEAQFSVIGHLPLVEI